MDKPILIKLLMKAFSDEDLDIFCMSNFDEVYNNFGSGFSRTQKIMKLITHCEQRLQMDKLSELIKEERPEMYAEFAPQKNTVEVKQINPHDEDLYKHCIKIPPHRTSLRNILVTAKNQCDFNSFIFLVYGASKKLSSSNEIMQNYDLFTKHIFKEALKQSNHVMPPDLSNYIFSSYGGNCDAIVNNILSSCGKAPEEYLNQEQLIDYLTDVLFNKIVSSDLIIPYKLIDKREEGSLENNFTQLKIFLSKYWIKTVDKIKLRVDEFNSNKTDDKEKINHSLVFMILIEEVIDDNPVAKFQIDTQAYLSNIAHYHHLIIETEYDTVRDWVMDTDGYFQSFTKTEILSKCECEKESFIPTCKTLEGLFEKIIPLVNPQENVVSFFKKFE